MQRIEVGANNMIAAPERISTGVAGLDEVLNGGLVANRVYLVEGVPGAGKTTLGLHFLLEGVRRGEPGLYITLSETAAELQTVAASHGWSLEGLAIHELVSEEGLGPDVDQSILHPSEVELGETVEGLSAKLDVKQRTKDKAAETKERAQTAQGFEDRSFWEEMEAKWLHLAESYAFVDRANEFSDSIKTSSEVS